MTMPSVGELAQLLTAAAAVGAMALGWWNARKIEQVRHATHSLTDRLEQTPRTEAHAAGRKEERESPRGQKRAPPNVTGRKVTAR